MLTRRDVLKMLMATPIAATFDIERALWMPSALVAVPEMPRAYERRMVAKFYGVTLARVVDVTSADDTRPRFIVGTEEGFAGPVAMRVGRR